MRHITYSIHGYKVWELSATCSFIFDYGLKIISFKDSLLQLKICCYRVTTYFCIIMFKLFMPRSNVTFLEACGVISRDSCASLAKLK